MVHKATSLLPYVTTESLTRFWSYVHVAPSGHWIWMGRLGSNGYPIFSIGYRRTGAHRFAVEITSGPIADGLVVDHLCRIPRCVNPVHLDPVTQLENIKRGQHHIAVVDRTGLCHNGHDRNDPSNVWVGPSGETKCRLCERDKRKARWQQHKIANGIPDRGKGHCTLEDCGREHYAKGFCKRHYQQEYDRRRRIA